MLAFVKIDVFGFEYTFKYAKNAQMSYIIYTIRKLFLSIWMSKSDFA